MAFVVPSAVPLNTPGTCILNPAVRQVQGSPRQSAATWQGPRRPSGRPPPPGFFCLHTCPGHWGGWFEGKMTILLPCVDSDWPSPSSPRRILTGDPRWSELGLHWALGTGVSVAQLALPGDCGLSARGSGERRKVSVIQSQPPPISITGRKKQKAKDPLKSPYSKRTYSEYVGRGFSRRGCRRLIAPPPRVPPSPALNSGPQELSPGTSLRPRLSPKLT